MRKFRYLCKEDKIFYISSYIILTLIFIAVLYPCIYVVSASFSSGEAVSAGKVILFPVDFSLEGYKVVLQDKDLLRGFFNSAFYTVTGTTINIAVTMLAAYPLYRDDLPGRDKFTMYFTFTMFFSGGMIPTYLVVRSLHMVNTIWAILLPGALSIYNMIMARTFLKSNIPSELLEASQLDGCSDFKFFTKIVLPLSKAVLAVLILFYAVGHWNSYFKEMIYLSDPSKYPLTIFLREILMSSQIAASATQNVEEIEQIAMALETIKYALIVVSMVPILCIYPFIQRHFVQGVMIGSVKG